MTAGAKAANINVLYAVEIDKHAAATYRRNHPEVKLLERDISHIRARDLTIPRDQPLVLFGGPPCQGFSTANQRTRSLENPQNWLFKHFIRLVRALNPAWVVFENVKGITETEDGMFLAQTIQLLEGSGYSVKSKILNLRDFGGPQSRSRVFVVGSRVTAQFEFPHGRRPSVSVKNAIGDLPVLENGARTDSLPYRTATASRYAQNMRKNLSECTGHLVTNNAKYVLERYAHVKPGGNWEDIPARLMRNYADRSRCHTGIYHRLSFNSPSVVIGNYRKNMLIHPSQNRGLSVREAARLQTFPDDYIFVGSIGFQQQQVGNAVPPWLAKVVFQKITRFKGKEKKKALSPKKQGKARCK